MFFLLQNRSSLLTKERLYSTSVEIVTINGGMDDTLNAIDIQSKIRRWVYPDGCTNNINNIGQFRLFWGYDDNVKQVFLAHLKIITSCMI